MPRNKRPVPYARLQLHLPRHTLEAMRLLLPQDARTGQPKEGAISDLVGRLLMEWIDSRSRLPPGIDPFHPQPTHTTPFQET